MLDFTELKAYDNFANLKIWNDIMPYCLTCGYPTEQKIPTGDSRPRLVCNNCGHIHYENPKLICGCILTHQNKILLCRRAITPRYGYWTLPAGFMELGETMAEGGNRECWEEAQASGEDLQLYCLYDIPSIGQIHAIFLGKLKDGAFGVGEESLECALFDEQEIPWNHLAFENITKTLQIYFNDRKAGKFPIHQITLHKNHD